MASDSWRTADPSKYMSVPSLSSTVGSETFDIRNNIGGVN